MPKGTRVHKCVQKMQRQGAKGGKSYAACQKSTNQSYATGKKIQPREKKY